MRDLFIRHDRLSVDQVERLKKRVETNSVKLEGIRAVQKDGWQDEADKIAGVVEKDKVTIAAQLNRRVFIRAWCVAHFPLSCLVLRFGCYCLLLRSVANETSIIACGTNSELCCTIGRIHS